MIPNNNFGLHIPIVRSDILADAQKALPEAGPALPPVIDVPTQPKLPNPADDRRHVPMSARPQSREVSADTLEVVPRSTKDLGKAAIDRGIGNPSILRFR